jgi:hypothetical protein
VTPLVESSPAPAVPEATPAPAVSPGEVVASRGRTLARVRSGKLAAKGRALAANDALPENEAVEVQSAAEVESEGAVALVLAPRSKVTLRAGSAGEVVFALAAGSKALARTAGEKAYALETPDARVTPLGTELLLAVESNRTRVSLLEGRARVAVERSDFAVDVRAGFEAEVARSKQPEAPRAFSAPRAASWVPEALRPKKSTPQVRVLKAWTFDEGLEGATKGEAVAGGARGSRGCVRAAKHDADYARVFEIDNLGGALPLDGDTWLEATVRVDVRTRVVLQVWDADRKENLAFFSTVEPGRWTTIAAPLRDFGDSSGKPLATPLRAGDHGMCFSVFAGELGQAVELLVDDVRFTQEK